ncbi:MAG: hypothetical protein PVI86_08910, partial [Phycisphaerae bacterium]
MRWKHLSFRPLVYVVAVVLLPGGPGCVVNHKQEQYFAVRDPNTGATNYYKMTVKGCTDGSAVDYRMQAGYFSAAAVDILRGQMPKIPELDLAPDQQEIFDALLEQFYGSLLQEAKRKADLTDADVLLTAARGRLERATRREESATKAREGIQGKLDQETQAQAAAKTALAEEETRLSIENAAAEALVGQISEAETIQADLQSRRATLEQEIADIEAEIEELRGQLEGAEDTSELDEQISQAATELEGKKADHAQIIEKLDTNSKQLNDLNAQHRSKQEQVKAIQSNIDTKKLLVESLARAVANLEGELAAAKAQADRANAARKEAEAHLGDVRDRINAAPEGGGEDAPTVPAKTLEEVEEQAKFLARLVWFGSLSAADVAAIGMTGSTDPFKFRKLVFWATVRNIDINELATEIDAVIEQVTDLGLTFKNLTEARKKEQAARRAENRRRRNELLDAVSKVPGSALGPLLKV